MPNTTLDVSRTPAPLYRAIARAMDAHRNARKVGNTDWADRHLERANKLVALHMPHGAGINSGTHLLDSSTGEKLWFQVNFHHMDEHGGYSGWSYHSVIVTPSLLAQFKLRITGQNRNDIKDYLHEVYESALEQLVNEYPQS